MTAIGSVGRKEAPSASDTTRGRGGVAPRGTRSLIAIECKYYERYLSLHLARGFHGMHADLGVKNSYFIANLRAQRIEKYLTSLGRNWERGVIPDSQEATFFVGALREAFKKYQSREGGLAP